MIDANEFFLLHIAKDVGIELDKIKKLIEKFEGWRIYFRKKPSEYERIRTLYNQMRSVGISRSEAVKELASIFEKSEGRIRIITKEQKGLFEGEMGGWEDGKDE